MNTPRLRWGILGTGMIAEKFAHGLALSETGIPAAVASRSIESAEAFLDRLRIDEETVRSYDATEAVAGYENLLAHPDLDAIYIALPNHLHREWTLAALRAGKHVLCEKPLALDTEEATELFAAAKEANRVLIEAFMYRTLPQTARILELVREGELGDLRIIRANFTFEREASRDDARYQRENGGGSLMDVGCYCIDFARSLAGTEPAEGSAVFHEHEYGVDDYAAGVLRFPNDIVFSFTCGMTVTSDQTTHIAGTRGRIEIPRFWFGREGVTLVRPNEDPETIVEPSEGLDSVYAVEADAFASVVGGGPNWNPPENTIANMKVLDSLRAAAAWVT